MSLFSAPIESVYNKNIYRKAAQSSVSHGFLYLLYLSVLITVLIMLAVSSSIVPEANRFLGWVKMNMPVLHIVPGEGVKMDAQSPYEMVHPEYGKIAFFDMNKTEIPLEEIKDWKVVVTSTKGYFQKEEGQFQIYDLKKVVGAGAERKNENPVIDAAFVQKIENVVKPVLLAVMLLVVFVIFFIWKLMAALFYSLLGMSFNLLRQQRLSYDKILNISFLAVTPAAWLQLLNLFSGSKIPFGFAVSFVVTGAYLYFGIKLAEDRFPQQELPPTE